MSADTLLGQMVGGRYQVVQRLGEGTTGTVYLAEHATLGRPFALKVLKPELMAFPMIVGRFRREASAAGRLRHPNIVSVSDFGQIADGRLFMVQEYVNGRSLGTELRALGHTVMPLGQALEILSQVAAALAVAHDAGIIHRDIKPDNILLTATAGGRDLVKVLDFGLAKVMVDTDVSCLTMDGDVFGTPRYMSPEQAMGAPADSRADIYAFGILAYELLAGRAPFEYENITKLLIAHQRDRPTRLSSVRPPDLLPVHPRLEGFVMQCLEKDREARPLRVSEVQRSLQANLTDLPERPAGPATLCNAPSSTGAAEAWLPTMLPDGTGTPEEELEVTPSDPRADTPEDHGAFNELRWHHASRRIRDLVQMLTRRGFQEPGVHALCETLEAQEERAIALESNVVRFATRIDELDEQFGAEEDRLQAALLELSDERVQLLETTPAGEHPDHLARLADQVHGLEVRLAQVYRDRARRQETVEREINEKAEQLQRIRRRRPERIRRLMAALQAARPHPLPSSQRDAWEAVDRLHTEL